MGPNWKYGSVDSNNGLALNRRQAIIWTNVGMLCWLIYASLGLNEWILSYLFNLLRWHNGLLRQLNDNTVVIYSYYDNDIIYNHDQEDGNSNDHVITKVPKVLA